MKSIHARTFNAHLRMLIENARINCTVVSRFSLSLCLCYFFLFYIGLWCWEQSHSPLSRSACGQVSHWQEYQKQREEDRAGRGQFGGSSWGLWECVWESCLMRPLLLRFSHFHSKLFPSASRSLRLISRLFLSLSFCPHHPHTHSFQWVNPYIMIAFVW